ncbi:Thioredoxin domain-containing protein [Lachnellula suecica]|uniref:Thioredoxin domain-containing protein n=1 Tax=Lachnellula suecica TaxID=602035 RepID=A0A8T9CEP3_9HELO|nr:Thioredoxin domain-containing protein [Lachnellula suecica]
MPISQNFQLPQSAQQLPLPNGPNHKFFIVFISSTDPATKLSWCPDVRAALPHINAAFSAVDGPEVALVEVGQRPEYGSPKILLMIFDRWKEAGNIYRTIWNVHNVPTLVRYERINGEVAETGRLVEDEILDAKRLRTLVGEDI